MSMGLKSPSSHSDCVLLLAMTLIRYWLNGTFVKICVSTIFFKLFSKNPFASVMMISGVVDAQSSTVTDITLSSRVRYVSIPIESIH